MRGIMKCIHNHKKGNRGETIVEVMVAFMVLLILLAFFGNSILAAGEAQKYAIDIRREADQGMRQLQSKIYGGNEPGAEAAPASAKQAFVEGVDNANAIKAVRYTAVNGELTYWVFE